MREECGIFGMYSRDGFDTARMIYYGLYALQHRGQESCGIAVNRDNRITCYKDMGLVSEVFDDARLSRLSGTMGIGHVRYSTTGGNTYENAQPLCVKYIKGTLAIAHNGNISNASELRLSLQKTGVVFQTTSDTEVISFLIARERIHCASAEEAVSRVVPMLKGSFSMLVMSPKKIIAVRDPYGIRPLCIGKKKNSVIFSSESCAIDALDGEFVRDLKPGEIVVASEDHMWSLVKHCSDKSALCIFEHIYFARPDSVIDGQSVYDSRLRAGRFLAIEHPVDADFVFGAPDSGIIAAIGFAQQSGIPYGEGLIKNRYVGRTFIQPDQDARRISVSIKLGALKQNVQGKRVVLVDDSIVRGTTITQTVALVKKAGAKEVHVRISAPQFLWPCYFGTDISDKEQLVSNHYPVDELCEKIGADSLGFLSMENLCRIAPNSSCRFCDACFSGHYPFVVPVSADKGVFEEA